MLYQNINIILALVIGLLLNVVSSWIMVSRRNRLKFLLVTIVLVSIFVGIEWTLNGSSKQDDTNPSILQNTTQQIVNTNRFEQESVGSYAVEANDKKEVGIYTIKDKEQNTYATFVHGKTVWLAQNLNITVDVDDWLCYEENPEYCKFYGKLYSLKGARKACQKLGNGWRLPTKKEFQLLFLYNLGGYFSKEGWGFVNRNGNPAKGFNNFIDGPLQGFNLQFGGVGKSFWGKRFSYIDSNCYYWADDDEIVYFFAENRVFHEFINIGANKNTFMSCRCVIDSVLFFAKE